MAAVEVDLRSDTVTKPTALMRKAMAEAVVGDDVMREDPTVIELETRIAKLLGKEAALFVVSGTMGNQASIMAHCWTRGQEMLVGDESHIYIYEQGGAAQLSGVHTRALTTKPDGTFDLAEVERKIRHEVTDFHQPYTGLICLENTHNRCGGRALPLHYVEQVCALAKKYSIPVHMDGARIINASVAINVPVATIVKDCDSVSMCFSKGLGAPVGSVVAGTAEFIARILRCRKVLGGALRQVGVLAAPCLVGLDDAFQRLERDHQHARILAKAVCDHGRGLVSVDYETVDSNMVVLKFPTSRVTSIDFVERLKQVTEDEIKALGQKIVVKTCPWHNNGIRCVLHSDISREQVEAACRKVQYIVQTML